MGVAIGSMDCTALSDALMQRISGSVLGSELLLAIANVTMSNG